MTPSSGTVGLPDPPRTRPGSVFDPQPVRTALASPSEEPALVHRSGLLEALEAAEPRRLITVTAPTGYGKTTLLWQWACRDPRSFVWFDVPFDADDPVALLAYVAQALHLLDRRMLAGPLDSEPFRDAVALPRLGAEIGRISPAFVLVLDDAHCIRSPAAWRVITTIIDNVPLGSHVVLSGRAQPGIPLGGLNAHRDVLQLGTAQLQLDDAEAQALLDQVQPRLSSEDRVDLCARSGGWPAALSLAARARADRPDRTGRTTADQQGRSREDEEVARYVQQEVIRPLPADVRRFLTRTSVLSGLTAASCDAVLRGRGSAQMLDRITHDHALLSRGDLHTFSPHPLVVAALRAELEDAEPELQVELHRRAAEWCRQQGDLDEAVRHSMAAGDTRRSAELIWISTPARLADGRRRTLEDWLHLFTVEQVLADPLLALTAAWCAWAGGRHVELWLAAAERAPKGVDRNLPPDTTPVSASTTLLRAAMAARGAVQMYDDAERVSELVTSSDPARPFAVYLMGVACDLLGDFAVARDLLVEGQNLAALLALPAIGALCSAQLALLTYEEGNWTDAGRWAARAAEIGEESGSDQVPWMLPVHTAAAVTLAHQRRFGDAADRVESARKPLADEASIPAWLSIQSRVVLARTHLLLGEPAPARVHLTAAEKASAGDPAPDLRRRLDAVWEMANASTVATSLGRSSITGAELKVLQLLPTHLSFQEIGARLHLSRNTVKTQAISVYRKLGVSSRSAAVAQAEIIGLETEQPLEPRSPSAGPAPQAT